MLEQIGMADAPEGLAERLTEAGAQRRDDGRILLSRSMVEAALQRAPSTVSLPGFVEDRGVSIGGQSVHIGTGGAAVRMLDAHTGNYRDSELRDLWTMMRVVDELPNIHYGLRPLVARDVTDELELDLNTAFAVTAATSKPTGVSFTSSATVDPVVDRSTPRSVARGDSRNSPSRWRSSCTWCRLCGSRPKAMRSWSEPSPEA